MGENGGNLSSLSATRSAIDLASKQLEGLRQCKELDDLYKKEINESENKLINMFGKLLLAQLKTQNNKNNKKNNNNITNTNNKNHECTNLTNKGLNSLFKLNNNNNNNFENLNLKNNKSHTENISNGNNKNNLNNSDEDIENWLRVVGVNKLLIDSLSRTMTLLEMVEMSLDELKERLKNEKEENDKKVLITAVQNLKKEMKLLGTSQKEDLSWTNFKTSTLHYSPKPPRHHHHFHQQRPSTSSLPSETASLPRKTPPSFPNHPISNHLNPKTTTLPIMTPPSTPFSKSQKKFPTTPPLGRKIDWSFDPLTKSKSHESQLFNKVSQDGLDFKLRSFFKKKVSRGNLVGSTEGLSASPFHLNTPKSDHKNHSVSDDVLSSIDASHLQVLSATSDISFRITHKFNSRPVWGSCDLCHRPLIFISRVCKYCKMKFHNDCAAKCKKVCGGSTNSHTKQAYRGFLMHKHGVKKSKLTQQQQKLLKQQEILSKQHTEHGEHRHASSHQLEHHNAQLESSSNSSCTSSSSSSPSYFSKNPSYQKAGDPYVVSTFELSHSTITSNPDVIATTDSDKSDKTITGSGCSSGEQTTMDYHDSVDSCDDVLINRDHSISLKDLSIPFEEVKILAMIGEGRFGTVYKGLWHGDVAIKLLNTDDADDNEKFQQHRKAFKLEVANLKKTKHESLVLFMGACVDNHRLAIVTSYIEGSNINDMIHTHKKKFALDQAITIASQVAQGLGFLHAKDIVHKNLRSNNIFLSKNNTGIFKVVITDYGLSLHHLCKSSREGLWLMIPSGWLSYQPPEVVRTLRPCRGHPDLPYNKFTDIYAFGTIWFELLVSKRPLSKLLPEQIIWFVGSNTGRPKLNVQPDYAEIWTRCWNQQSEKRPSCEWILRRLKSLPKKRLSRSPSHPLQINRSVNPIF